MSINAIFSSHTRGHLTLMIQRLALVVAFRISVTTVTTIQPVATEPSTTSPPTTPPSTARPSTSKLLTSKKKHAIPPSPPDRLQLAFFLLFQCEHAAAINLNVTQPVNASPSIMLVTALFNAQMEVTKLQNLDVQLQVCGCFSDGNSFCLFFLRKNLFLS